MAQSVTCARMDYRIEDTYTKTRLPVELASTLIADAYRSDGYYTDEQEQIFAKGWVGVGATSEVAGPGDVIVPNRGGEIGNRHPQSRR